MAHFIARSSFPIPDSIPKTYFLGHHQAGVDKIKTILPLISLVLECRDFRLPFSTYNPHLEQYVAGRDRLIVYTKTDLGTDTRGARDALTRLYGDRVVFWSKKAKSTEDLINRLKEKAARHESLTGMRALVVGMPNVGKSTVLNALRRSGTNGKKVAHTGDQAGVTRKVGSAVRVVASEEKGGVGAGVYVVDTPGIFQPYVKDGEMMIKIALVNGIKKGLIDDSILADYLLYKMNLINPALYARYCEPTNDVDEFLIAVAKREGKLMTGGKPNVLEAAATVLSRWRDGNLGRFVLDNVSMDDIHAHEMMLAQPQTSMTQLRKLDKEKIKKGKGAAA